MEEIRVVVKNVGEKPKVVTIKNEWEEFSKIVDGYLETVPYWPEPISRQVHMYCNEKGKLRGLDVNINLFPYDMIVGNIFFSRVNDDGETVSITDQDIEDIEEAYGWIIEREEN